MRRKSVILAICGLMVTGVLLMLADQQRTRTAHQTWNAFLEDLRTGNLVAANRKCNSSTLKVVQVSAGRYQLTTSMGSNWLRWPVNPFTAEELKASFAYAPPAPRLYVGDSVPVGPAGSVWFGHLAIAGGRVTFVKSRSSIVEVISDWMTPPIGC